MLRMKVKAFGFLILCLPSMAIAAIENNEESNLLKFTEEEVSRDLEIIENKEAILQAEINQKIKAYHAYKNGASEPLTGIMPQHSG